LLYRGYDVNELAEKASFEETFFLMLYRRLPLADELDMFVRKLASKRDLPKQLTNILEDLPEESNPMDVLRTIVSIMGTLEPES
jgi:2-methylcitrate synthase